MVPAGSTLGRVALRHLTGGLPVAVRQGRSGRAARVGPARSLHATVVAASDAKATKEKKPGNNDNRRRQAAAKGGGGGRRQPKKKQDDDSTSSAEDIRALRLEKVKALKEKGYEPYAYRWDKTHSTEELQVLYKDLTDGEEAGGDVEVSVAGRIMARRVFGKLAFLGVNDEAGSIQLYCDKARLEESSPGLFEDIKALTDVGDIVGVKGGLKRTEKGELSVVVSDLQVLTKSLLPLPDKFQGLKDIETRYRQRYVDLITNPGVLATFRTRALITSTLRRRLEDRGFLEMETPVLHGEAGGADARPFNTFHNALGKPLTMRIATELHLKRLVVGGFERVFEIGRIFRNEGVSTRHNPEFTSVEVYEAYADYHDMMDLTEDLVVECCKAVHAGGVDVEYQGEKISFAKPWRRETMHKLVQDATGVDFEQHMGDLDGAKAAAAAALEAAGEKKALGAVATAPTVGHVLNEVFEAVVESTLVQPTFVLDHPLEISPLSKPHRSRAGVVERFEVFAYGRELANSFSELTDPIDQRERLEAQIVNHKKTQAAAREAAGAKGKEALAEVESEQYEVEMDEDFVTALEYGMPPTAGMGMGVDRLVMLLTDSPSIRDVVAFPAMK